MWLPPGETLQDIGGLAAWSPDADFGELSVASAEGESNGDDLLAVERGYGEVVVDRDERLDRGGVQVRRLRYRSWRSTPREVIDRGEAGGRAHVGGEVVETLADFLIFETGGRLIRAGYAVRADAPESVRESLAQVYARLEIGAEGSDDAHE